MRKNVVKIVVVLALAIILSGLCLVFTACEEEKEPVCRINNFYPKLPHKLENFALI